MSTEIADDPAMLVHPSPLASSDILVPWGVSQVMDSKVKVGLTNLTNEKVTLTKRVKVAELEVPQSVQVVLPTGDDIGSLGDLYGVHSAPGVVNHRQNTKKR